VLRFLFKFTTLAYLPLLLVAEQGASVTQAGLVLSVSALAAAVSATQMVRVLPRTSVGWASGVALTGIGGALLLFALTPAWYVSLAVGLLYGAGDGAVSVIQDTVVAQSVAPEVRNGAMAFSGAVKNSGKLAAPLVMSALVATISLSASFVVMAFVALAGAAYAAVRGNLRVSELTAVAALESDGAS
jgi:predicted MFS family arabinose efflux permease